MCPTGTWSAYASFVSTSRNREEEPRTHHLLDLGLLERRELAGARLHVELSSALVLNADVADALGEGRDLARVDVLEDLGSARIARVGVDLEEGLDFRDARDDSSDGDELAEVGAANLAHGQRDVRGEGAEVEIAARRVSSRLSPLVASPPSQKACKENSLSPEKVGREDGHAILFVQRVASVSLELNHVEDVGLGRDVVVGSWEFLVKGAGEELDVALSVALDSCEEVAGLFLITRREEGQLAVKGEAAANAGESRTPLTAISLRSSKSITTRSCCLLATRCCKHHERLSRVPIPVPPTNNSPACRCICATQLAPEHPPRRAPPLLHHQTRRRHPHPSRQPSLVFSAGSP